MKKNDVEYINAFTPFDHGLWEGKNVDGETVTFGDKALYRSRSLSRGLKILKKVRWFGSLLVLKRKLILYREGLTKSMKFSLGVILISLYV